MNKDCIHFHFSIQPLFPWEFKIRFSNSAWRFDESTTEIRGGNEMRPCTSKWARERMEWMASFASEPNDLFAFLLD